MSKYILVFLLCIAVLLGGCSSGDPKEQGGVKLREARTLMDKKAKEIIKANSEADLIIYNDSIYEKTEKTDVKTKDELFKIASVYNNKGNFEEGMATKLPIGTMIKSVEYDNNKTPLLFADLPGNPKVYKLILNPYSSK